MPSTINLQEKCFNTYWPSHCRSQLTINSWRLGANLSFFLSIAYAVPNSEITYLLIYKIYKYIWSWRGWSWSLVLPVLSVWACPRTSKCQLVLFKLGTAKTQSFCSKKSLKMAIGGIPKWKGKYAKQVFE